MTPIHPNEILLLIGDLLVDKSDRLNLMCVNHRFYHLFLPLLYRCVLVRGTETISFVQALLRKPQRTQDVRVLFLMMWEPYSLPEEKPQCDPAFFREIVEKASHSTEEHMKWERGLIAGWEDAWMALLLVLLGDLRRLLVQYVSAFPPYISRVIQRAANREKPFDANPGFPRLEEVFIEQWNEGLLYPSFYRVAFLSISIDAGVNCRRVGGIRIF